MKDLLIGIDPGVHTGMAIWDGNKFLSIRSTKVHTAILAINEIADRIALVRIEDARLRSDSGVKSAAKAQGAGSVKRDSKMWEDFLHDFHIPYEMVKPTSKTIFPHKWLRNYDAQGRQTDYQANPQAEQMFARLTGWEYATTEHERDAAWLVFNMKAR